MVNVVTPAVVTWGKRQELFSAAAVPVLTGAGAYTAGNNAGGVLSFAIPHIAGDELEILGAEISDVDKQSAATDLLLFDDNPAASTLNDKVAANVVAADLLKHIDTINFATASYAAFSATSVCSLRGLLIPIIPKTALLYAALVTRGTPTYLTVSSLNVRLFGRRRV